MMNVELIVHHFALARVLLGSTRRVGVRAADNVEK
jgi:hypothetical protein